MKFNELTVKRNKVATRSGRGISGGRGKTAGRGTKGQGARKSSTRQGFAGGQTPLYMQIPKLRGFKSQFVKPEVVYTGQLDSIKKQTIDNQVLADEGLISNQHVAVKLINKGELKTKKTVRLQAASAGAVQAVEKAGGQVETVSRVARESKKLAKKDS
jgi:large subunit ribosomal protein L15